MAARNTGAIFIFWWGCNGKVKVSVPVTYCCSIFPWHRTTHRYTQGGKRSYPWQDKRLKKIYVYMCTKGWTTWKATGLSRLFPVSCNCQESDIVFFPTLISIYDMQLSLSFLFFQGEFQSDLSQIYYAPPPFYYTVTSQSWVSNLEWTLSAFPVGASALAQHLPTTPFHTRQSSTFCSEALTWTASS